MYSIPRVYFLRDFVHVYLPTGPECEECVYCTACMMDDGRWDDGMDEANVPGRCAVSEDGRLMKKWNE